MKYDPKIHHRQSIRLKNWDYSQSGAYFITLVTYHREEIFGKIVNGKMQPTPLGEIACKEWFKSLEIRNEIRLFEDEFVIMPNHIHGIVWLIREETVYPEIEMGEWHSPLRGLKTKSLSSFITGYKSVVTGRARRELDLDSIWQRNYFEHIIRDETEYLKILNYVAANPILWLEDQLRPSSLAKSK